MNISNHFVLKEQNDDGTNTVFSVEEPKSIGLTNPRSILTGKYGVQIGGVSHCWNEVFNFRTKIILVDKIVEVKSDGYIKTIMRANLTLRNCARVI